MTIKINNDSIRIRPSAVVGFYDCAYRWGKSFLEGSNSIPNSRAAIGTAIHAGVEAMWTEAIKTGTKDPNLSMMTDAAMQSWKEETHDGVAFGDGETDGTCAVEILNGTETFVEDILPFSSIPTAVEKFYKVDLIHPLVSEVGGTIDYITKDTIGDLKTSKRKTGPDGHRVQQSIYKYLANANGENIKHNLIQQVVLKKQPEGAILTLDADIDNAKYLINGILDTLDLVAKDVAPIETLLRPNASSMFCSPRFCSHYDTCPGVSGNLRQVKEVSPVKL